MSGLPEEVRGRTDNLDAVGNTTAAAGKGFAIASAALTALALFAAFVGVAGIDSIDIYKADVLAGLLVGAMIPFVFSALAIAAVGRAAMDMVQEVRRQFKEIPGIMEYKATPEYEKCVEISTKASIREMMMPGAIALVVPIIVGFAFGPEVLGGLLAGVTVSGVLMGIFQNNAGGAWDNAKKSFEKGVMVDGKMEYKGSEPHKASVTGDTVGDPFKDTSGPSMNILIKLMSIVSLVIAPHISEGGHGEMVEEIITEETTEVIDWDGNYTIDPATTFRWKGEKVGGQHFGDVSMKKGTFKMEGNAIRGGEIILDMTSIKVLDITDPEENGKLTGHLHSADFFAIDEFPEAKLVLTNVRYSGQEQMVYGELTMKGITQEVVFDVFVTEDNGGLVISTVFNIDRTDFGIEYKSKKIDALLDNFIYDEIEIKAKFRAVKS
jgi:polyisoprenoid-binding protein YceI